MNVNFKKYPILQSLEKGRVDYFNAFIEDSLFFLRGENGGNRVRESFNKNCSKFKRITFVSKAFHNSFQDAMPKIHGLWKDVVTNDIGDIDISGTYIIGDIVYFIKYKVQEGVDFEESFLLAFYKGVYPIFFLERGEHISEFIWVSNASDNAALSDPLEFVSAHLIQTVLLEMFKTYASVETKFVPAKSKSISGAKYYKNDTNLDVTYLTSKWFTNLVRSEGFSVRGHFRMQPKKVNGEWTKELIWIESFEKTGYTHKAQITNYKNKDK